MTSPQPKPAIQSNHLFPEHVNPALLTHAVDALVVATVETGDVHVREGTENAGAVDHLVLDFVQILPPRPIPLFLKLST